MNEEVSAAYCDWLNGKVRTPNARGRRQPIATTEQRAAWLMSRPELLAGWPESKEEIAKGLKRAGFIANSTYHRDVMLRKELALCGVVW